MLKVCWKGIYMISIHSKLLWPLAITYYQVVPTGGLAIAALCYLVILQAGLLHVLPTVYKVRYVTIACAIASYLVNVSALSWKALVLRRY